MPAPFVLDRRRLLGVRISALMTRTGRRSRLPSIGDGLQFAFDCQYVVAMRMMRLAGSGRLALREAERMVTEKAMAGWTAQAAAAASIMRGDVGGAVADAAAPYLRTVRKNWLRLGG